MRRAQRAGALREQAEETVAGLVADLDIAKLVRDEAVDDAKVTLLADIAEPSSMVKVYIWGTMLSSSNSTFSTLGVALTGAGVKIGLFEFRIHWS
ncbi:hypothetical protein ACLOJK_003685 [Asimina triloba]